VDLQHAVVQVGAHVRLVDPLRHRQGAREGAEAPLRAVEALALDLGRALARGRHGQRALVELHRDRLLRDAGEIERVDELAVRLPYVHGGEPGPVAAAVRAAGALEHRTRQPAHLVLEARELPEGLPTNERCHASIPPCDDVDSLPG
jgi:hypothetical protein